MQFKFYAIPQGMFWCGVWFSTFHPFIRCPLWIPLEPLVLFYLMNCLECPLEVFAVQENKCLLVELRILVDGIFCWTNCTVEIPQSLLTSITLHFPRPLGKKQTQKSEYLKVLLDTTGNISHAWTASLPTQGLLGKKEQNRLPKQEHRMGVIEVFRKNMSISGKLLGRSNVINLYYLSI